MKTTTKELGLSTDEKLIFETKVNKGDLVVTVSVLLLLSIICFSFSITLGIVMMLLAFLSGIKELINIKNTICIITNKKVLHKSGLFSSKILEQILTKIEAVYVEQSFIDKIFNSGTVVIVGTGGTKTKFKNINEPFEFKQAINELIHK